jgi:hypothetical protein
MTVRDQIPLFPELISPYTVRDEIAHGTSDHQQIASKYYSIPEREHAEELAFDRMMDLLRMGLIRATGRRSDTRQGSSGRWQSQRYKQHSKMREYIDREFWDRAIFIKSAYFNTARSEHSEYTDLMLVLDDCREQLAEDVAAHGTIENKPEVPESEYSTPYIDLMWRAIDEFKISTQNQPIKDNLVEWFLNQEIAGQKISQATANYLASFVRLPESRTGGNRPWKVREQRATRKEA